MRKLKIKGYVEISEETFQDLKSLDEEVSQAYQNKDYNLAHQLNLSIAEIIEMYKDFIEVTDWDYY